MSEPDEESRLLAAIFAAPTEDAPRAEYAAWLTARGAPLGRFISAQLAGDVDEAETHWHHALAALATPVLGDPPSGAFKRGFLWACVTRGSLALPSASHGAWGLIEHLKLLDPESVEFVTVVGPRLSSLRIFQTERGEAAESMACVRPRALEKLSIGVMESWFDLSPLIDERTVVEIGLAGVFEVRRDPGRVHLSPSPLPFRPDMVADALRVLVRPDDEVSFVFMGDRTPVDAVRAALDTIPHRVFTEHELGIVPMPS